MLRQRLQKVRSFLKGDMAHQEQSQSLAPVLQVPGLFPDHLILPCSIKVNHLKVVLGDQDLKKTEFHEQSFGVEKIFKYSNYNERDEIPHNDIGKFFSVVGLPWVLLWVDFSTDGKLRFSSIRCSPLFGPS